VKNPEILEKEPLRVLKEGKLAYEKRIALTRNSQEPQHGTMHGQKIVRVLQRM